ncbi:BRCT and tudor domain DNA checkpoint protein Crb2 [Schizosaccharomyces osmophilus]|uniref:BRCT and tudor domain DNA checkpoint protein Crb2 n=1 Tax=Schizosaccharomyces osmophilus TaxID=2545709 RepID=A0AAE9WEV1_9SCHI|nr:BRCT and tudor domain DNA checkpoint protein Crb2 [Schizosaccharomyces osmophilus]WBW73971.1 BRCT and tudor domain DNA checkpoint protein Crb2 [Schizosaccharomyces osmophilus]
MQKSINSEFAEHKSSSQQAYPLRSVAHSPVRFSSSSIDLNQNKRSQNSLEGKPERIRNSFENVETPANENDGLSLTQLFEVPTQAVEPEEKASEGSDSSHDEIIIQNPSSGSHKASTPNRAERVLEQLYNQQGVLSQQNKIVSPQSFPNSPEMLSPPGSAFPGSMTSTLKDTPAPHSSNEQATGNMVEDVLVPDTVTQERRYFDYPVGSFESEADAAQIESTPTRHPAKIQQLPLITGIESTPPTKLIATESDHKSIGETKSRVRHTKNIISDTPVSSRILIDEDSLSTGKRKINYNADNELPDQSPPKTEFNVPKKRSRRFDNVSSNSDSKTNDSRRNKETANSPELEMEPNSKNGKSNTDKPKCLLPNLKERSNQFFKVENRVLAFFKGYPAFYYPATVLSQTTSSASGIPQFKIQFDDSTTSTVNVNQLKRFELKEGDIVRSTALKLNHIVLRTYNSSSENISNTLTDVFGNDTVLLRIEKKDEVAVPMSTIYLIPSQIRKFKDRDFQQVPELKPDTDTNSLPSSISRKRLSGSYNVNDDVEKANQSSTQSTNASIFQTCVFVFTGLNTVHDNERSLLINLVKNNGGAVLDEGFSTLCCNYYNGKGKILFPLKPHKRSQSWKYAFVISDTHSRKVKYLEALALNLPCVHPRFITICLEKQKIVDHSPFLLAAGYSRRLNTILSQRVRSFPGFTLYDQLQDNSGPLSDKRILFLLPNINFSRNGLASDEYSQRVLAHMFQALALGAEVEYKNSLTKLNSHWDVIVSDTENEDLDMKVPIVDFEWIIECVISYSDALDL